jgi:molybdopterin-guanine dinucleotide biosynthesis protein B
MRKKSFLNSPHPDLLSEGEGVKPELPVNAHVPILGFAAWSGTGKTTLLKRLIPRLTAQGLRLGLVKHAHHAFEIDYPGKDSYELRKAGACRVMLSSSRRRALIVEHPEPFEPRLADELAHFDQAGLDLVLVEGFKRERFPKIELHRPALGVPLLFPDDPTIIAIATDAEPAVPPSIPRLDLNDPERIAGFILRDFLSHAA